MYSNPNIVIIFKVICKRTRSKEGQLFLSIPSILGIELLGLKEFFNRPVYSRALPILESKVGDW